MRAVTVSVMLFTRDLRLTDNPALTAAARGGAVVPLRYHSSVGRVSGPARDGVRVSVAPGCGDHPCPSCETRRRRHTPAGAEPAVWYDTLLEDWVVQLPCDGLLGGALLPLEIYWFDANWADVYRTAADVCYCDDAIAGA